MRSRSRASSCFEEGVGVGGQPAQLVELGVVAGGEHPAVADEHRRRFHHRAVQQRRRFRKLAVRVGELLDAWTVGAGARLSQSRHGMQRGAKLREVAGPCGREADAGQDALEVSDVREQRADRLVGAVFDQGADRVQAFRKRLAVANRTGQPAAQEPASHRRRRAVHDRGEGRGVVARQRVGDLEIAARDGVQDQSFVMSFEANRGHVRQCAALRVPGVDDQRPGRTGRKRAVLELERREIVGAELLDEDAPGRRRIEVPGRDAPQRRMLAHGGEFRRALAQQDLGGTQPLDLGLRALGVGGFGAGEPAARELQPRDAPAPAGAVGRHQQVVAACLEQVLVGECPRGDDPGDPSFHRTARCRRVADLLADRGRSALAHELREIRFDRMRRHARHRNRSPVRAPARSERDVEQLRGAAGIVEEQLVEISHPVEEQGIGMVCLDAQILRDDGSVPGCGVSGHGGHGQGGRIGGCELGAIVKRMGPRRGTARRRRASARPAPPQPMSGSASTKAGRPRAATRPALEVRRSMRWRSVIRRFQPRKCASHVLPDCAAPVRPTIRPA